MAKQYYEFKDKTSSKFWEIDAKGKTVTVRFGKSATDGQTTVKTFASPKEATDHAAKVTAEKVKKGYKPTKATASPAQPRRKRSAPANHLDEPVQVLIWVELLITWKNLSKIMGDGVLSEWSDARIDPDCELNLFYDQPVPSRSRDGERLVAASCERKTSPLVVVGAPVSRSQLDGVVQAMSAPETIKALARRFIFSDTGFRKRLLVEWSGDCRDMPDDDRPQLLKAVKRRDVAVIQKIRKTLSWGANYDDWRIQSAEDLLRWINEGAEVHRYDELVAVGVI